ncbi:hypothetical protein D3C72_1820710 [compost metagenome]
MHRTTQAAQWPGDGERHEQAEQGQYHQGNTECTQRPKQAVAVPGIQLRVRNTVDQQVGFATLRAGVLLGQAAPGQASVVVVPTRLEGCRTTREGARNHGFAAVVEYLYVNVVVAFASFQKVLRRIRPLLFVALGPFLRQGIEARVTAEDPGILVQHVPEQDRQACDQGNGQPETGQDAPEQ